MDRPLFGSPVKDGRTGIVKYHVAQGADTSLENSDGNNPQELQAGQIKIAELIAAAGK